VIMGTVFWRGGNTGGAYDGSIAQNYSPAALPTDGDDLYFEPNPNGTNNALTAGLTALSSVILNSLNISQDWDQYIGTSTAYFVVQAATARIGYSYLSNTGSGSARINWDAGTTSAAISVLATAPSGADSGLPPLRLLARNAATQLNILGGSVGFAMVPGELGEVGTVSCMNSQTRLYLGAGATVSTLNGGTAQASVECNLTTITVDGGTITTVGTMTINTLNCYSGVAYARSNGTIDYAHIGQGGQLDLSGDTRPKTVTTIDVGPGSQVNLDNGVAGSITITNPITGELKRARIVLPSGATIDIGY